MVSNESELDRAAAQYAKMFFVHDQMAGEFLNPCLDEYAQYINRLGTYYNTPPSQLEYPP